MYHFCTLFDHNYLTRALVLFDSLLEQTRDFVLHAVCTSDEAYKEISRISASYPQIKAIHLRQLEALYPELLQAKSNRSIYEYYFTLSPAIPHHLLTTGVTELITYLDADLCFYDHPKKLYDELGEGSILVTEHRFSDNLPHLKKYGRFNVQYQSFRLDEQGMACLERWRQQCLDWCYDRIEGAKFADQGYLTEWPDLYSNLVISQNQSAGIALWNVSEANISIRSGHFYISDNPLVFFHFHSFKHLYKDRFVCDFFEYKVKSAQPNLRAVYIDYLKRLNEIAGKYQVEARHSLQNHRSRLPLQLQLFKQAIKGNIIRVKEQSP